MKYFLAIISIFILTANNALAQLRPWPLRSVVETQVGPNVSVVRREWKVFGHFPVVGVAGRCNLFTKNYWMWKKKRSKYTLRNRTGAQLTNYRYTKIEVMPDSLVIGTHKINGTVILDYFDGNGNPIPNPGKTTSSYRPKIVFTTSPQLDRIFGVY